MNDSEMVRLLELVSDVKAPMRDRVQAYLLLRKHGYADLHEWVPEAFTRAVEDNPELFDTKQERVT